MLTALSEIEKEKWMVRLLWLASVCGILAFATLLWEIGWPLSHSVFLTIRYITWAVVICAALAEFGLLYLHYKRAHLWRLCILVALPFLGLSQLVFGESLAWLIDVIFPKKSVPYIALGIVQLTLVFPSAVRLLRLMRDQRWFQSIPPALLGLVSFALLIVFGTCLLKTPNATVGGISWLDACFTSASAVCVTGLSTLNIETQLTFTGQAILLFLIQVGGLGVVTLAYFLALMAGQGINLRDRVALRDLLSEDNMGKVGRFVWHIIFATLLIESIGILLLRYFWQDTHIQQNRLWWDAIFHSISAFCNAGFSTYGAGLMHESLVENRPVQAVIMVLIILGGFGFALFSELTRYLIAVLRRIKCQQRIPLPRLTVHSRVAMVTTACLLFFGWLFFFLCGNHSWEALFNSVSCRTAGFNISNFGDHTVGALMVALTLMFVGGNPGGTAGGIKTTTLAICLMEILRVLRGRNDLNLWDRRVARDAVERSVVIVLLALLWCTAASAFVGQWNPELKAADVIFECVSAFGTVGLSRGITSQLSDPSKMVIILTMFCGRVGILAFFLTLFGRGKTLPYRLPETRVPLG